MENTHRKVDSSSKDNRPYACLKKILSGKCDRPNCPYDHSPDKLRVAAQDVLTKSNTFLKSQSSKPNSNNPTLMVRDKGKFKN